MDHFDEASYVRWEIGHLFVILREWKLKLVKVNDACICPEEIRKMETISDIS